jgi:pimeloyl-ACP methyl ester carboxylesterase
MSAIYRSAAAQQAVEAGYRRLLDAWPVPKEELQIPTGQGETFVIACGPKDAPPLVAFHGAQANSTTWMFDVLAWSQDFRVYLVDVPGDAGFSAPERPALGSDAYVLWLDQVLAALSVVKTSIVGVSLGGWLALDYATRRPERVARLALLCPAGVGAQKNLLLKVLPLLFLGKLGQEKVGEMVFGPPPRGLPVPVQQLVDYLGVVAVGTRPRPTRIPTFPDAALARLTMPLLAIVGGQDVLIDSAATRDRLRAHAPGARVIFLPQARHLISGQTAVIHNFLRGAA